MEGVRRSASAYFLLQGIAVLAWWAMLFVWPESRVWFRLGETDAVLLAFWIPDLLFAACSFAAGVLLRTGRSLASSVAWLATGLITCSTLYCLAFALATDTGWPGVAMMTPAMIASGCFSVGVTAALGQTMFRPSADGSTAWLFGKTLAQTLVIWTLVLYVIPEWIVAVERKLGLPQFTFSGQNALAWALFLTMCTLGLVSAYTMSKVGRGTPLPMDTAERLVVSGPYRHVRNPMAVAGIGQGLAVGVVHGSWLVMLYSLTGAVIWQLVFRPLEEDDLVHRFGAEYERYREHVRCWIPGRGVT